MTLSQSMATLSGKMPSSETLAPFELCSRMSFRPDGWPDISRPTSKPSFMPSSRFTSASDSRGDIDGAGGAELRRQFESLGIDVGDHDVAGAGEAADGGGHAADRAGAGDQDVLGDEVPGQRGVDGVAERVEDRDDLLGDARVDLVDVAVGDGEDIRRRRRGG